MRPQKSDKILRHSLFIVSHKPSTNQYSDSFRFSDDHVWCDPAISTPSPLAFEANSIQEQSVSVDVTSDKQKFPDSSIEDSDDEDDIDFEGWIRKPIKLWTKIDTANWLLSASQIMGQLYREISPDLVVPGKQLLFLSREDFLLHDPRFGAKLYDSFRQRCSLQFHSDHSHTVRKEDESESQSDDGLPFEDDDSRSSDEASEDSSEPIKRRPGRPRKPESKMKEVGPKIWEFVRNLLLDPKYCPELIRWENYEERKFRFVDSQKIAELWGSRNNNPNMNFEKFSRAMRYYYNKDILRSVPQRKLVYQFGPLVTGFDKI